MNLNVKKGGKSEKKEEGCLGASYIFWWLVSSCKERKEGTF